MTTRVKLEPFSSVGASQTAIANFRKLRGNTIKAIFLQLTNITHAQVGSIKLTLNETPVWELTGVQLNTINLYNGHPTSATHLALFFSEPRSRNRVGELAGALDASRGIDDIVLEVTLTAGPVGPAIVAYADIDPPLPRDSNVQAMFRAFIKSTLNPGAAAEHSFKLALGKRAGAALKRVYNFHAQITNTRVLQDSVEIYNANAALNSALQDYYGHDPQAGLWVIDFVDTDNQEEAKPTVRKDGSEVQYDFLYTVGAADVISAYADCLVNLNLF